VATASYLDAVAGGMVTGAAFGDDDAAVQAVTLLRDSGVRKEDISVIAADPKRAQLVAGDRAWLPWMGWRGLRWKLARMLPGSGLPRDVTKRYGAALRQGKIAIVVAAGGQPPDTLAALLQQARGDAIEQWWQAPTQLFAPPELAGPF
jgi:hypothetical protein